MYLIEIENFLQNTALCYLSNLKSRLKDISLEVFVNERNYYSRLRDQIKKRSEAVAGVEKGIKHHRRQINFRGRSLPNLLISFRKRRSRVSFSKGYGYSPISGDGKNF